MTSIIIVSYYHKKYLAECIASIKKNDWSDFEIIVVNNSPQERLEEIQTKYPEIKIIDSPNLGYSGGNNLGARIAKGEYLAFLNPDVVVGRRWLSGAIKALGQSKAGIVMSMILSRDGKIINSCGGELHYTGFSWSGGFGQKYSCAYQKPYPVNYASGTSLFITKKLFDELDGFDQDFFMYVEDLDLSFRAKLLGYRVYCAPTSIALHDYEFNKGDYKLYYLERNRYFFIIKNYSLKMMILILPALLLLEVSLWFYFLLIGKLGVKIRSMVSVIRNYLLMTGKRKIIQSRRKTNDLDFVSSFVPKIEFQAIDNFALRYLLNPLFFIIWSYVKFFFK